MTDEIIQIKWALNIFFLLQKCTRYSFYEASAGQMANEALCESKQIPEALPGPSQLLNFKCITTNTWTAVEHVFNS